MWSPTLHVLGVGAVVLTPADAALRDASILLLKYCGSQQPKHVTGTMLDNRLRPA
jgi:hypothetical protein